MNWETFKPEEHTNPFSDPKMPSYDEIPEEFKRYSNSKWSKFFNDMFFIGIQELELKPNKGIDKDKALNHLRLWARSFEPKHEHKEAAFAYMASIWFKDVKYKRKERNTL